MFDLLVIVEIELVKDWEIVIMTTMNNINNCDCLVVFILKLIRIIGFIVLICCHNYINFNKLYYIKINR